MKKLFLFASCALFSLALTAATVDANSALAKARSFIIDNNGNSMFKASTNADVQLVLTECNATDASLPVYYIFNTDNSYIIVAGDDRAEEILAYGDTTFDPQNVPANMQFWLDFYKDQIEKLQANPDIKVVTPSQHKTTIKAAGTQSIEPMLTAMWNQEDPYYYQCPRYSGQYCYTGCPATALAEVFYYWKYPTQPTPAIPAYVTESQQLSLSELPPITFDWDNMLETYTKGNYTTAQSDAVGWLMRYIGQAEEMDYTILGSGAFGYDVLRAVKLFGYDQGASIVYKSEDDENDTQLISDDDWAALILNELQHSRPVVFCGYHYASFMDQYMGHCFDIDGYDAETNKFHINWGWSGNYNGNFAINAFTAGGFTYNIYQQIIIGIQPPVDFIKGDVNGDGDVNVMDITALIDIIMNDGTEPRADVNEDGDINVMDITALIDIIMNS